MNEATEQKARDLMARLVPCDEWVASLDAERRRQLEGLGGAEAFYGRTRKTLEDMSA